MKKGFTIAEVLISLTIVGVIAAMTLPTLNVSIQKQQAGPGLMKALNSLEQANMILMNDRNSRKLYSACGVNSNGGLPNVYLECIGTQLNSSTITNTAKYYNYNKTELNLNNVQGIQTKDGITYYKPGGNNNGPTTYLSMNVDINGPRKGPNTVAYDVFSIQINPYTGNVFAYGSRSFSDDVFNMDGNRLDATLWNTNNNCTAVSVNGPTTCAGSIVENGGKVIYPW